MLVRVLADIALLTHAGFVVFVMVGGLLILKWPWVVLAHLPSATWGALVEFQGWRCPLTSLEQSLLEGAGSQGYAESFVSHHLLPLLYPTHFTELTSFLLGTAVISVNIVIYAGVITRLALRHNKL